MTAPARPVAVAALLALPAALASCAGSASQSGVRIGDETLRQFKAGVTTEAWVRAILGEPTAEARVEDVENTTVLRYSLTEANTGLTSLFTGAAARNTAVVYFIVTDGLVTRYWADRETERTILGTTFEDEGGVKTE